MKSDKPAIQHPVSGIKHPVSGMPSEALSDKDQAMPPDMFAGLMKKLQILRSYMILVQPQSHEDTKILK